MRRGQHAGDGAAVGTKAGERNTDGGGARERNITWTKRFVESLNEDMGRWAVRERRASEAEEGGERETGKGGGKREEMEAELEPKPERAGAAREPEPEPERQPEPDHRSVVARGGGHGRADGLDGLLWEQRTEHKAECDAPSQCGRRGERGVP